MLLGAWLVLVLQLVGSERGARHEPIAATARSTGAAAAVKADDAGPRPGREPRPQLAFLADTRQRLLVAGAALLATLLLGGATARRLLRQIGEPDASPAVDRAPLPLAT